MNTALVWFRHDLRLADNPALSAALAGQRTVVPIFIHDPQSARQHGPGAASRWWLHHSLNSLSNELARRGSRLIIRSGAPETELASLVAETSAGEIHCNRVYDPAGLARDADIRTWAEQQGLRLTEHKAALLVEPWEVATGQGKPYRVFTPFYNSCRKLPEPSAPLAAPDHLPPVAPTMKSLSLSQLKLLPKIPWDAGLRETWQPGETAAMTQLDAFSSQALDNYGTMRDRPDRVGTSRLSPYLHRGELSPRQIYWQCRQVTEEPASFLRQLYWREFAHHLLYHFPHTVSQPLDRRFEHFPWAQGYEQDLRAWQQGRTGIPMVDAGMRELWHSGWMHNRVRMLVASLLTKNLLIPWQEGARWFWDTLVDADLANNTLGWQWTAGCGADAAPFFRIFNPVLQGKKFDPQGRYVRRWLPELAAVPDKWLHEPWEASETVLDTAGLCVDSPYRKPIVDLKSSRQLALGLWDQVKGF